MEKTSEKHTSWEQIYYRNWEEIMKELMQLDTDDILAYNYTFCNQPEVEGKRLID